MVCSFFDIDRTRPGRNGLDEFMQYQMVPFRGRRRIGFMALRDEPEDVIITPNDKGAITFISSFSVLAGSADGSGNLGIRVKPDSAIELVVEGRNPGRSFLEVNAISGGLMRAAILVAVKPAKTVSYQVCVLSDPIRKSDPVKLGPALVQNMRGAEEIWLKAANILMNRVGEVIHVQMSHSIGKPILLDTFKVGDILAETNRTPGVVKADVFVYATWDLRVSRELDTVGLADPFVGMAFVENQLAGKLGSVVAAHEMGHVFQLGHPTPLGKDASLLMDGFGEDRLRMHEIDRANPL
jgi:hypothetical protein